MSRTGRLVVVIACLSLGSFGVDGFFVRSGPLSGSGSSFDRPSQQQMQQQRQRTSGSRASQAVTVARMASTTEVCPTPYILRWLRGTGRWMIKCKHVGVHMSVFRSRSKLFVFYCMTWDVVNMRSGSMCVTQQAYISLSCLRVLSMVGCTAMSAN